MVHGRLGQAVTDKPVAVTVLGDPLVIFREPDGEAGVLLDVCPHRAVPLSLGTVSHGRIVCPYHGIELDTAGVCRRNPHVQEPPERLRARLPDGGAARRDLGLAGRRGARRRFGHP